MSTSLRTLGEIKGEFLVRMNASTTVAYYTDSIIGDWADQSYKKAAGYRKWPFTEGRVSTTFTSTTDEDGIIVGSYPEGWKSDSIRYLTIGGKRLQKKNYYQFRKFVEDNSSDTSKIFTDFGRLYYINPNIGLSGTLAMFGQYTPVLDLTDEDATTVFSDHEEDGNSAIVELMQALAFTREKKFDATTVHEEKAKAILDEIWKRVGDEQFEYQTTDGEGMFKRIDIVRGDWRQDTFRRDQFS